jgi:hypothetical protein
MTRFAAVVAAVMMTVGSSAWTVTAEAATEESISGSVSKVDSERTSFEVTAPDGKVRKLELSDDTSIRHDGQDVPSTHLQVGQEVQVMVKKELGKDEASVVTITAEAGQAPAPSAELETSGESPSANVERTEVRSEAMSSDRGSDSMRTSRLDREIDADLDGEIDRTERVTARTMSSVDERGFRSAGTIDQAFLADYRIVPNATMRPGASVGGPMSLEGEIRAALPLGREPESQFDAATEQTAQSEWRSINSTTVDVES